MLDENFIKVVRISRGQYDYMNDDDSDFVTSVSMISTIDCGGPCPEHAEAADMAFRRSCLLLIGVRKALTEAADAQRFALVKMPDGSYALPQSVRDQEEELRKRKYYEDGC